MAAELLVDAQIDDGRRVVDQLVRDGFEVTVAFWLKAGEDEPWHLYITSPKVNPVKPGDAYRALYASLSKVPDSSVQFSQFRLVNDANPAARDAVALHARHPLRIPIRYRGERLGNLSFADSYIYVPLKSLRRSEEVTIYGLSYKGEPTGALFLSLELQNPNARLIVEEMGHRHEYPADTSTTWAVSVPGDRRWNGTILAGSSSRGIKTDTELDPAQMRCGVSHGLACTAFDSLARRINLVIRGLPRFDLQFQISTC